GRPDAVPLDEVQRAAGFRRRAAEEGLDLRTRHAHPDLLEVVPAEFSRQGDQPPTRDGGASRDEGGDPDPGGAALGHGGLLGRRARQAAGHRAAAMIGTLAYHGVPADRSGPGPATQGP